MTSALLGVGTGPLPPIIFICFGLGLSFSEGGNIGVPETDLPDGVARGGDIDILVGTLEGGGSGEVDCVCLVGDIPERGGWCGVAEEAEEDDVGRGCVEGV